jgi:hypothetical protein
VWGLAASAGPAGGCSPGIDCRRLEPDNTDEGIVVSSILEEPGGVMGLFGGKREDPGGNAPNAQLEGHKNDAVSGSSSPPAATHPPITTCPVCRGTSLSESKVVGLGIVPTTGNQWQGPRCIEFSMVICDQCGRVDWFAVGAVAQYQASTVQQVLSTRPQGTT